MSTKLQAAVIAAGEGERINVAALCRGAGVSRKTFYKWVKRYREGGIDALHDRSRRPLRSPMLTPADVEDGIVRLRKELLDAGVDHGATTIQWHLGRQDEFKGRVPSISTVHRVLQRRDLVVPQPKKRPKSSWQRFEAGAPNERWQIDSTDFRIRGATVKIFNIIDDCSRVAIASRAVREATTEQAWTTFCGAGQRWGLPATVLSDNGLSFSGRLRGFEVFFEAQLRDHGITPKTGRAYHPQTTGKVERFQQTLKKWLHHRRTPKNLAELQGLLDEFCDYYNNERPHQGIGRRTPIDKFNSLTPLAPNRTPLEHPEPRLRRHTSVVDRDGRVQAGRYCIHIGTEHAGQTATTHLDGLHANVFINAALIRHLTLDPTRSYQPSGRKRGPKPRIP